MSLDRVWAVVKPKHHKVFDHKPLQLAAFACSVILGVLASIYDCFRYSDPVPRKGTYTVHANFDLLGSWLGTVASLTRNGARIIVVMAIIVINLTLFRIYAKRRNEIRAIVLETSEARKHRSAFRKELTLALLTGAQCFFISMEAIISVVYYAITYAWPSFDDCEAEFLDPALDAAIRTMDLCEVYAALVISRQFRRVIIEHAPWLKKLLAW